jgi:hypothetical protein
MASLSEIIERNKFTPARVPELEFMGDMIPSRNRCHSSNLRATPRKSKID